MNGNPYGGERMDRTLTVVIGVLAVAVVLFLAVFSLTVSMGIMYRASLTSTYDYRVSIGSDTDIGNVTFYLPIPGRLSGNSAVLEEVGSERGLSLPAGWTATLLGTEKVDFLELNAREVAASPQGNPYLISLRVQVRGPIVTESDGFDGLVIAPLAPRSPVACPARTEGISTDKIRCEAYRGTAYADFTGPAAANLRFTFNLTGRNAWDVFGPSGNEYRDGLQVSVSGSERGWKTGDGLLVTGLGDYGMGFWVDWTGRTVAPSGRQVRVTPSAGGRPA